MTEFLAVLAFYYMCDAAAEVQVLPADEAMACSGAFEVVKAQFGERPEAEASEPSKRARQGVQSYLAFKRWESENAELVEDMKRAARLEIWQTPSSHSLL